MALSALSAEVSTYPIPRLLTLLQHCWSEWSFVCATLITLDQLSMCLARNS